MSMRRILGVMVPLAIMAASSTASLAEEPTAEIARLKAEIEELKARVPSQSHAMMDIDYHFTNLWFAAQSRNWPLAQFYLNETRSHLRWAVRIIPVRRIPGGEIDL